MNIYSILLYVAILALSISFHEMMHSYVALRLGDHTAKDKGRISMNPLAHIDPLTTVILPLMMLIVGLPPFAAAKPVPINGYSLKGGTNGMALVALAGPLSNLVIALVAGGLFRVLTPDGIAAQILIAIVSVNLSLFVFNMIPWPPLDGSRLLYAIAPDALRSLMNSLERTGYVSIVLLMLVVFPSISGFITAIFSFLFRFILGV